VTTSVLVISILTAFRSRDASRAPPPSGGRLNGRARPHAGSATVRSRGVRPRRCRLGDRGPGSSEWVGGTGYTEPSVAIPVARARRTALRKLDAPRCRQLIAEFKNLEGVPLDSVLAARGHTAETHLQRMTILNGTGLQPCRQRDVYAFTSPGTLSPCTSAITSANWLW
jgi:hypothetical protein